VGIELRARADLAPMKGRVRRGALIIGGSLLGFLALLGLEVAVAIARAENLTGFPSPALDGRIGTGAGEPLRIVWVGDSTGEGTGASSSATTPPHVFARGLGTPVDLTVLAVSGARVADALVEQVPRVAGLRPDWVVLGIGSNDVTHVTPRARFRRDYEAIIDAVEAAGPDHIIALGIGEFAATPLFWQPLRWVVGRRGHALEHDQRAIASARGVTFVDIRGRTGPSFVAEPVVHHAADGFHPSDIGYALWADAILATIRTSEDAT
jgi:lysophospholipase L1-like esterase